MKKKKILLITGICLLVYSIFSIGTIFFNKKFYSFDGAEGFGAFTDGGRYGTVYHVTSLEDTNIEGTLRYAIEQPTSRLIVFDISGIIDLKKPLVINDGNITIAGQTAPGDGICLKGNGLEINANNVIIRYLRIRPGKTSQKIHALAINNAKNIIIDHCSISWATGGNILLNKVKDITIQWCFINETMGEYAINFVEKNKNVSIHHNLFGNNHLSNISFNPGFVSQKIDIRNNVFFNWDTYNITNPGMGDFNIIKNYYKFGSNTEKNNKNMLVNTYFSPKHIKMIYINGNEIYINPILSNNNLAGIYPNDEFLKNAKNSYAVLKEYYHEPISTHSGTKTKQKVLDFAGASLRRDYTDTNIVKNIDASSFLKRDLYKNFGVYPVYNTEYIFVDMDNDGIRDDWEIENKLNPFSISDAMDKHTFNHMYTNRDIYLDSFVKSITKQQHKSIILNIDSLKIKFYKIVSFIK
jgi:hypothetical protein